MGKMTSQPETGKIYQGDCLEIMRGWPDKCIDLILTDPPYGLGGKDIIDFRDGKSRRQDFSSRIGTVDEALISKHLARLLAPKGTVVIWMADRQFSKWWDHLTTAGILPRYSLIWEKTNPMPQLQRCRPTHSHEVAIVATQKDNWGCWNGNAMDRTVMVYGQCQGKNRPDHPCPKPIELIQKCVYLYSNQGCVVMDCFLGSGTTALAAEILGRRWVGIEKEPKYCAIAQQRIDAEMAQEKLF